VRNFSLFISFIFIDLNVPLRPNFNMQKFCLKVNSFLSELPFTSDKQRTGSIRVLQTDDFFTIFCLTILWIGRAVRNWQVSFRKILLLLIIGAPFALKAETAPYEIALRNQPFIPPAGEFFIPSPVSDGKDGRVHLLIQLEKHLQRGDRARFEAHGIRLLHYFPDRAYVASMPCEIQKSVLQKLGVRWAGSLPPESKIHPRILQGLLGDWSGYDVTRRVFAVSLMKDVGLEIARGALTLRGFEVGDELHSTHLLFVAALPEQVRELAALDFVLHIAEAPPPLTPTNDIARQRVHADEVQLLPYDLSGRGVTALVYDGDIVDRTHNDFSPNRVILGESYIPLWHATHVAGTLGGNGTNSNGQYRGMAPEVRMVSMEYEACVPNCLYDSPQDIEENYQEAMTNYGAEVANNSLSSNVATNGYPCAWEGDYETTSQLSDAIVRGSLGQPFIVVFAAGNERSPPARCGDNYGTMGVPAGAKNIITVGASDDEDNMSSFSSWGPTDDGRLKPELCAPGVNITSTFPGNDYYRISGTSMATPVVSGCIALLLEQWHRFLPGHPAPLPETVKALLVASALDRGNIGPDFRFGHGIINIQKAIDFLLNLGFFEAELNTGETFSQLFEVPDTLSALDIALAWSDVPGEYNVTPSLVNDLNLWLVSPSAGTFRPWVLNPAYPDLPAGTGIDSLNVVERVHVDAPESGQWTLFVGGILPGSETQSFAVAGNVMLNGAMALVRGLVRDSLSQEPLAAKVEVAGGAPSVNANTEGKFALPVFRDSTYAIRAWLHSYRPDTELVAVGDVAEVLRDFDLTLATSATIEGHVYNMGGRPVAGATISIVETPVPAARTDTAGYFSLSAPGGAVYQIVADYEGSTADTIIFLPENEVVQVSFALSDLRFLPSGPDTYGYVAYEQNDIEEPARFDWLEISPSLGGPGAVIHFSHNDSLAHFPLPFVFRYYSHDYTEATLCADGWLALGFTNEADRTQSPIPDSDGPAAMIAPFWDDMDVLTGGDVSTYYDESRGRFIIEFNRVPQHRPRDSLATFQLILYDPLVRPTPSCDGEIVLQYALLQYFYDERDDGGTVGIESPDELTGMQIVFDAIYNIAAFPIRSGTAIRFTTAMPTAYGSVAGQVHAIPPLENMSEVIIAFGCHRVCPDTQGCFAVDSVVAGTYRMEATCPGYETGLQEATIDSGLTTWVIFEIWRLDPPRNLQASVEDTVVTLTWQPPLFEPAPPGIVHDPALSALQLGPSKGGGSIESLSHYKVYRDGEFRASVEETTYVEGVSHGEYEYWVVAVYDGGESDTSSHVQVTVSSVSSDHEADIPNAFFLSPNYPNPFNATTRIEYGLPRRALVRFDIFDVLGRRVARLTDGWKEAGYHELDFDARRLPTGLYFCQMRAADFRQVHKMLLIR